MSDTYTETMEPVDAVEEMEKRAAEEVRELNQLAAALANHLFSASKTVQLHALDNRASLNALSQVSQSLKRLGDLDGRATVRVSTDLLMVNNLRVVVDTQSMGPVVYLVEEMKRRRTEEIDFDPEVTEPELGRFLKLFFGEVEDEDKDRFGALKQKLTEAGIERVRITEWIDRPMRLRDSKIGKQEIREESNKLYGRLLLFTGEVLRAVEHQRAIPLPKALRLTQQVVDIIQTDESILVGLASIKDYDEYTFAHSTNVAVLSMLIADRIGMRKCDVAQIGLAALVHDIGKTHVPHSILNKEDLLSEDEWKIMQSHTMFGAVELSRAKTLRSVADALFVALQHHVRFNGEGYPQKAGEWDLLPVSRIVTVADYFDAMTTPRVYKKQPLTPDKALRFILDNSGTIFDPFIAKVFIQVMGLYPVGSILELDTGERAVTVRQNRDTRFMHRPVVSLIPSGETVDLTEEREPSLYARTVVRALFDPDAESQKVGRFLVNH